MLIIHLQNPDDHEFSYVKLSGNAASGAWKRGNWGEVSRLAQRNDVVLLIPTRDVLLMKTTLVTGSSRHLKQALPYAVEENLVEDPALQHFVWQVHKDTPDVLDVAVISRETLKAWMALLKKHRIKVRTILPDVFALPIADDEHAVPTFVQHNGQVLVRTGTMSGFSCPDAMMPLLIDGLFPEKDVVEGGTDGSADDLREVWLSTDQPSDWHESLTVLREPQSDMLLSDSIQQGAALNLLSGYQDVSMSSFNEHWKRWRVAAVFAVLTLGILVGIQAMDTLRLKRQLAEEEATNIALFKQVFPEITNFDVRTMRSRVKSEIKRLEAETGRKDSGKVSPLPFMATVAQTFGKEKQVKITEVRSRKGNLVVRFTSPSAEVMDKLGKELAASLGFEPRLEISTTADGAKATLTLEAQS
uniref:Type II secretion system protein L n=1 Tax=uncultured Thiotrichaceae bacterium TaxID=298394 RepID=A0A6S6UP08_9GAMM|nr:MAG: Type II secretion system protein L [uncultured Thiotrichaceae bacterium]